jgi:hypothetical protein
MYFLKQRQDFQQRFPVEQGQALEEEKPWRKQQQGQQQ